MRVKLTNSGKLGRQSQLTLGDVDVSQFTRGVEIRANVDEMVTANVELFVSQPLDVELDAQVYLTCVVLPGYDLVEEATPQGRRIRAVASKLTESDEGDMNQPSYGHGV